MTIDRRQDGDRLTIALTGRLDTATAPQLEKELKDLSGVSGVTLDFSALEYISSAGLRVLLGTHKALCGKGGLKIVHVNELVQEVFDVTGFAEILDVE